MPCGMCGELLRLEDGEIFCECGAEVPLEQLNPKDRKMVDALIEWAEQR